MFQIAPNLNNPLLMHSNFFIPSHDACIDMNRYPNVLTPPMDSPDSIMMLSPSSGSSSPNAYTGIINVQPFLNSHAIQNDKPYLTVLEDPVERFRFRYKSEMAGTHGSLTGKNSDRSRKQTFPTVQLHNYDKPAVVRCSLYQYGREDMPDHRQPHAHRLVKRHGVEEVDDPHDMEVDTSTGYVANFHSMGIIHTAKKNIVPELIRKKTKLKEEEVALHEHRYRSLTKKEELEIKSSAEKDSKSINLNIVCLRFDAFKVINNVYYPLCLPVYSNSINNLKSALTGDLKIVRMDHCTSPCRGGREIFILVEKVTKKNIKVRFYELDDDDNELWSDFGKFNDLDVHHQYAIVFKTPPYKSLDIDKQVKVYIELQRPSDGARSEAKDFIYTPCDITLGRKRLRQDSQSLNSSSFSSGELPLTIAQMPFDEMLMANLKKVSPVSSADLEDALKGNNVDSEEFQIYCENLMKIGDIELLYKGPIPSEDLKLDCGRKAVDIKPLKILQPSRYTQSVPLRKLDQVDQKLLEDLKNQFAQFMKTKPSKERVRTMLESLFEDSNCHSTNDDTILHMLIIENGRKNFLIILLKLLLLHKLNKLVNICNNDRQTPLHLAVEFHNETVIEHLLYNKADISLQDSNGNTALHIAILKNSSMKVLKLLLSPGIHVQKFINIVNNDGLTPLHLTVQSNDIEATKLLCWHSVDVNAHDIKSGHTVLHMAVAEQHLEIIEFLLEHTEIDTKKEDFKQCTALTLAKMLMNENASFERIYFILENLMKKKGVFEEVDIKEEIEDMSEEDIDEFKQEPMSPDPIAVVEKDVVFTEKCLEEVSVILDESGTWQNLAELLDLGHLLRNNLFQSSKTLLTFAIANGESVVQIREFLGHLDETKAVEIIDRMITEQGST